MVYCLFNYNKMKRKMQRKEEEICGWGVEQEIEREAILLGRTKRVAMLPDLPLTNKYPSAELPSKKRKPKINPQQYKMRRMKSESAQQGLPLAKDSQPSLPTLPSLARKISKSEPAIAKQPTPAHPTHNKSFVKYDEMHNYFDFKFLQKKVSAMDNCSKELSTPSSLKRRGSELTLKVQTIQMLNKEDEAKGQKKKQARRVVVRAQGGGGEGSGGEYQFNDGGIFSHHPILYTSIHSPVQFKGESKTDRYRIIIK